MKKKIPLSGLKDAFRTLADEQSDNPHPQSDEDSTMSYQQSSAARAMRRRLNVYLDASVIIQRKTIADGIEVIQARNGSYLRTRIDALKQVIQQTLPSSILVYPLSLTADRESAQHLSLRFTEPLSAVPPVYLFVGPASVHDIDATIDSQDKNRLELRFHSPEPPGRNDEIDVQYLDDQLHIRFHPKPVATEQTQPTARVVAMPVKQNKRRYFPFAMAAAVVLGLFMTFWMSFFNREAAPPQLAVEDNVTPPLHQSEQAPAPENASAPLPQVVQKAEKTQTPEPAVVKRPALPEPTTACQTLHPHNNAAIAYTARNGRCEGVYIQPVSGNGILRLSGFHLSLPDYNLASVEHLTVEAVGAGRQSAGFLRAVSLRPRHYYLMETALNGNRYEWDTGIIKHDQVALEALHLGVLYCAPRCELNENTVLYPVRVFDKPSADEKRIPYIVINPQVNLQEIALTLVDQSSGQTLMEQKALGWGRYRRDKALRIPLKVSRPGRYGLRISAQAHDDNDMREQLSVTVHIPPQGVQTDVKQ